MKSNPFKNVGKILAEWNPIGVPDGLAYDEYQSFIPGVIQNGASIGKIKHYLIKSIEDMGLEFDVSNPAHQNDIAEISKKIFMEIDPTTHIGRHRKTE